MGDCAGSPQFPHIAYHDFRVVRDSFEWRRSKHEASHRAVLHVHRSGTGSRGPQRDRSDKIEYRVAKLPIANVLRTVTIAEPRGFMKMLIGKENDEIVCFTASGIEASELMAAVHTRWLDDCRIPRWAMRSSRTRQCLRGWSFFWDRSRNATPNRPRIACRPAKSCSVLRETPFPSNTKGTIQMAEVHQFPSTGSHEEVTPARRDMTL